MISTAMINKYFPLENPREIIRKFVSGNNIPAARNIIFRRSVEIQPLNFRINWEIVFRVPSPSEHWGCPLTASARSRLLGIPAAAFAFANTTSLHDGPRHVCSGVAAFEGGG